MSEWDDLEAAWANFNHAMFRIQWVQFWTNTLTAWLYGGYRERWRGRGCPMDN